MLFRKFEVARASLGLTLAESEERIEKLVDAAENEPRQKCNIFDAFSKRAALVSVIKMRNRGVEGRFFF